MGYWTSYGVGQYVAAEAHSAILPRSSRNGSKRAVVFCHGSGGNALSYQANHPELYALAAAGVPVISCDLGGASNWGNATALARIASAWDYAKTAFGAKTDKMLLHGGSMGGMAALNYARANPSLVAAVGGVMPAIDAQDIHANNRAAQAASIAASWGGSAPPDANNPADNAAAHSAIPIKLWYSTDDSICLAGITTSFAAAAGATAVSLGAVAHNFPAPNLEQPVTEFLRGYS